MNWEIFAAIAGALGVIVGIIQVIQNRKKEQPQVLSEAQKNDVNRQEALDRIVGLIDSVEVTSYVRKVNEIKNRLPEQSIYSLAIRSHIHNQLLNIAILVRGGFAGIGYPGRILQISFPVTNLIGVLPKLIDARDPHKLETTITDFFEITEPNLYGIVIPNEEYQIALQTGIFIVNRLEKIEKLLETRRNNGQDISSYIESEID